MNNNITDEELIIGCQKGNRISQKKLYKKYFGKLCVVAYSYVGKEFYKDIVQDSLIKFFNKQEDAREISASINACSRMGYPEISIGFCLGNKEMKKEAGKIYVEYKQNISSALKYINELNKIEGKNYTIINARDKIKDTIIGTTASIMSHSPLYPEGTIIVAMAYNEDKIKVSARLVGKKGRNVREVLTKATIPLKGEVGGHPGAAGCLISKEHEEEFTKTLKNLLEVDFVKIE